MTATVVARVLAYTDATADAWLEYLDTIRNCGDFSYAEIEPWAWTRLQQRLLKQRKRGTS